MAAQLAKHLLEVLTGSGRLPGKQGQDVAVLLSLLRSCCVRETSGTASPAPIHLVRRLLRVEVGGLLLDRAMLGVDAILVVQCACALL